MLQIQHRQFGKSWQAGLHANSGLLRINADSKVIERHLNHIAAHLLGIVRIVGHGLRVSEQKELAMRFLQPDPVF